MKRVLVLLLLVACSKDDKAGPAPTATPGVIRGEIDVAPELKAKVTPEHVIFVSARKSGGGGPPLAAKRLAMSELPIGFQLSKDDAMMQGGPPFEGELELTVRIDGDGDAMTRQPGDLVWKAPATVGGPALEVLISEALP